jgi:threonine aldolase
MVSHIYEEEAGALAANAGVQVFPIRHQEGKIDLEALKQDVAMRKALEYHSALPKVVSIANTTEYGTYYLPEEVKAIADFCHSNDMYLHMDGCRLVNVAATLNLSLRECTREVGVDILSFGGAKNGLMSAEAVVIFNAPESDIPRMQKQTMQLVSKMRYVSGQFIPYMQNNVWRENASNANTLAKRLAEGLKEKLREQVSFTQPVVTNQVFCIIPDVTKTKLRAAGYTFYDWNSPGEVRFVTAWDNTAEDVDDFLELL